MAKRYLLLAALSALMLGACSDDNSVNGEPDVPQMQPNTLPMNVLSASSQAGRISVASATRGPKSERLQRVATIAPVSGVGDNNWSATAVTVRGGNAYVTWHSDRQATTQATAWGGAIDVINIPSEAAGRWEFSSTATNEELKFNHVYTDGTNLYLAATSAKVGAAVGRVAMGDFSTVTYLDIPGSSANAVAAFGTGLVAVSGYDGAAVSFPANFDSETEPAELETAADDFGGKYVEGGYILRTNGESASQLIQIGGETYDLNVGLVSGSKDVEKYDYENKTWIMTGKSATCYGKHTMTIDNGYAYIATGMSGLYSYALGTNEAKKQAGVYTTAVCADDKYVYAATEIGLRVYEKKGNGELELFAFEVETYNEDGTPADHGGGTNGHSANFVALGGGYIFVAYGQSGVYVFKLNEEVPVEDVNVTVTFPGIENGTLTESVAPGTDATFTVPAATPEPEEGKEFVGWKKPGDDNVYTSGEEVTITAGDNNTDVVFEPVWKDKVYAYVINFVGNLPQNAGDKQITNMPEVMKGDVAKVTLPTTTPVLEGFDFQGWWTEPIDYRTVLLNKLTLYKPGDEFTATASAVNLYTVFANHTSGGGDQGGEGGDVGGDTGGNTGGGGSGTGGDAGAGDSGSDTM